MKFTALVFLLLGAVTAVVVAAGGSQTNEPRTTATPATSPPVIAAVRSESASKANAASQADAATLSHRRGVLSKIAQRRQNRHAASAVPPFRLASAERDALLRRCFPKVDNPEWGRILADPELIVYTEDEMPKAYQFFDGAFPGVHSTNYNISANGSEPFGNGNREFPWSGPVGTHRTSNVGAFRFVYLPRDAQGRRWPIVWYPQGDSYAWTFPVGAVVGEVLTLRGPDQRDYTFEVRLRRREVGFWEVDVLRPFPTAVSLAKRIRQLRPNLNAQPQLRLVCNHLETAKPMPVFTLADLQPNKRAFSQTLAVDDLPTLGDDRLVCELLTKTPFRS
ncbi:MAG TPA: hypothetical protein VIK18_14920, partial [Pirellulales bacterium]